MDEVENIGLKILLMISSKGVNLFSEKPELLQILVEARQRREEERRRQKTFSQTQQIFLLYRMTNASSHSG